MQGSEGRSWQNRCVAVCFSHHTGRDAGGVEVGAGEGRAAAQLCRMGVPEGWGTAGRDTGQAQLSGNLARVRVQQTLSPRLWLGRGVLAGGGERQTLEWIRGAGPEWEEFACGRFQLSARRGSLAGA